MLSVFEINRGGLAIYGGVLGGVAVALIYCKVKRISFWSLADTLMPSLVLGQAIGRWGNFVNQEAYGNQITNPSLCFYFLMIGALSFGGGYGMVSLVRETVISNGWLTESEFLNFIAVSESTPGPLAVNMATFIGSTQGGILDSFLATLGVVLLSIGHFLKASLCEPVFC